MEQVVWEEVRPILSEQSTEQVAFAQYVVNIGSVKGGVINLAAPGQRAQDLIRPRPQPPHILPRRVSGFVDRETEQRVVGQALARDHVVDLHGPHGIGKTALISYMLHALIPGVFPDGIVYLSARAQARADLLQDLFESFYETAGGSHVKVHPNEVRRYLAGKRALVAVDDCDDLEEGDAETLSQAAPQSALLIAGHEPQAWDGTGVSLSCLPRAHALTLLARYWGRPLDEDPDRAGAICSALGDVPLAIVKTARSAAARGISLDELRRELEAQAETQEPKVFAGLVLGHPVSEGERLVLSALAAPGGDSVDRPALVAIAALPATEVARHLTRLAGLGLVHQEEGRYRLDEAIRPDPARHEPDAAMRSRAAGYYGALVARLQAGLPGPDEPNVLSALRHYAQRGQWREVIQIARALEPRLAITARWGQWRRVLDHALEAARQAGDGAAEAWAHNQLGVVALGAADPALARQFFQRALRGWLALGDRDGTTVARWNLRVLLGPPPPPTRGGKPVPSPAAGPSPLALTLVVAAAVLVVGLGLVARQVMGAPTPVALATIMQRSTALPLVVPTEMIPTATLLVSPVLTTPVPTVTFVPTVVTRAPRPVTVVPPPRPQPWLDVTLAGGCGRSVLPGGTLVIRLQSNVNGTVAVYLSSPRGERELLFRQPLSPNQVASISWPLPDQAGRWALEGSLDNGQATARCAFVVEPPTISVWLEGQECGQAYQSDSEVASVLYRANVDGNVLVFLPNSCQDEKCPGELEYSDTVRAEEIGRVEWYLPWYGGPFTLRAALDDGQASAECVVNLLTPPDIGESWYRSAAMIQAAECVDEVVVSAWVSDPDGVARVDLRTRPRGSTGDWSSVPMTFEDGYYRHRLVAPGVPTLEYQIYVEDARGASAASEIMPLDARFCVTTMPPEVVTTVPPEVTTAVPLTVTTETPTPSPTTTTPVPPTDTPTPSPTATTPVPPTDTPAPPTDTPVPPTDTPVPPTDTPIPPTDAPIGLPGGVPMLSSRRR